VTVQGLAAAPTAGCPENGKFLLTEKELLNKFSKF
jgi:hypothetical protein